MIYERKKVERGLKPNDWRRLYKVEECSHGHAHLYPLLIILIRKPRATVTLRQGFSFKKGS